MAFRPQLLYHSMTGFSIYPNQWAPKPELTLPDRSQGNTQTSTQRIVVLLTTPFFSITSPTTTPTATVLLTNPTAGEQYFCFRLLQEHTHLPPSFPVPTTNITTPSCLSAQLL